MAGSTGTSAGSVHVRLISLANSGFLDLHPDMGAVGTNVNSTGQVATSSVSDQSCSVSSPTSGAVITGAACAVNGGGSTRGNFTGSFIVGSVAQGQYVIEITACAGNNGCAPSAGDFVQAVFTVTSSAQGTLTFNPSSASGGIQVSFSGGFPENTGPDTSCSLSSPNGALILNPACVTTNGGANFTGSFTVGSVVPGEYLVEVTGCVGNTGCAPSAGDFVQGVFTVAGGVQGTLTLSPPSAAAGTNIRFYGGFPVNSGPDTSCSVSSPTSAVVTLPACVTTNGGTNFTGSFTVGSVPLGEYVIEITGCAGNTGCAPSVGDFVQAVFTTQGIIISPTAAGPGSTVQVSGSGFSLNDDRCTISGSAVSSYTCSISSGSISGSFVVANIGPGYYTITVSGDSGDSASATIGVAPYSAPAIPGFPLEAILAGLLLGAVFIALLRRKLNAP
jgi:hypothetical protein